MAYRWSDLDRKLASSFSGDYSRSSLKSIELKQGTIRGLRDFTINFSYPLSAICGKNGSGKSTILALAACAFHSHPRQQWRMPGRKTPYYTYSEFFIQTHDEVPVDGIELLYGMMLDNWKIVEAGQSPKRLDFQSRTKSRGGKWTDYATRAKRAVGFLGIDRVVPPSEKSVLKNYRWMFASGTRSGVEDACRASVGRVIGVPYDDFEMRSHGNYRLPLVKCRGSHYSGFNMGAGEQALFGLFTAVHSAPRATLFLIDEIELGLHEAAQRSLMEELKRVASEQAHQFIFTTHSPTVLALVPPEARFLIEKGAEGTAVTPGVSPGFAAGRMAEKSNLELVVYVEDENAKALVVAALDRDARSRCKVVAVGSHSAVVSQLASRFNDSPEGVDVVAFLDGDQRSTDASHKTRFVGLVDQKRKAEARAWIDGRLNYLPSDMSPERFAVGQLRENALNAVVESFGLSSVDSAVEAFDRAMLRGGHGELYWISEEFAVSEEVAWQKMCALIAKNCPASIAEIPQTISIALMV